MCLDKSSINTLLELNESSTVRVATRFTASMCIQYCRGMASQNQYQYAVLGQNECKCALEIFDDGIPPQKLLNTRCQSYKHSYICFTATLSVFLYFCISPFFVFPFTEYNCGKISVVCQVWRPLNNRPLFHICLVSYNKILAQMIQQMFEHLPYKMA